MADRLLAFALGTFHTLLFFVPFLLLLHLAGNLEALLALGTRLGVLVFLLFWTLTVGLTWAALHGIADGDAPIRAAAVWGAAEGLAIVVALVIVILTQDALFALFALIIASPFGLLIGALVGILLAGVDLLLMGPAPRPGP